MNDPFKLSNKEIIALELFREHHEKCRGSIEENPSLLSLTITNTQAGSFVVAKCEKCQQIKIISDRERIQESLDMATKLGISTPVKIPSYMTQNKD